jgi:hypothetical protein
MSLIVAAKASPQSTRFASFLAAALVLHGLLLLLPAQRGLKPSEVLQSLSITLQGVRKPAAVMETGLDPAPAPPASVPVAPTAAPPATVPTATVTEQPPLPPPPMDFERTQPDSDPDLSAARLLDDAFRMRWEVPGDAASRRLGQPAPRLRFEPARSAGRDPSVRTGSLPDSGIEVVDRWRSADGSQNLLVRTASGGMLCGRAEAWDPLRPMAEPVMMWRDCGSGEPTFEWPDSYRNSATRLR